MFVGAVSLLYSSSCPETGIPINQAADYNKSHRPTDNLQPKQQMISHIRGRYRRDNHRKQRDDHTAQAGKPSANRSARRQHDFTGALAVLAMHQEYDEQIN